MASNGRLAYLLFLAVKQIILLMLSKLNEYEFESEEAPAKKYMKDKYQRWNRSGRRMQGMETAVRRAKKNRIYDPIYVYFVL